MNILKFELSLFKGDHLLTAINVARDCEMLPIGEKVIIVTATPPNENSSGTIKYSLAEMDESNSSMNDNIVLELVDVSDETLTL